jgi:hypothetical protein
MRSAEFNQLFNAYRQQAIETSAASISQHASDSKPMWLQLLQRHVQEWKQHYGQESQALEQIKDNYQRIRQHTGSLSQVEQLAILANEDRELGEVTMAFQVKRDLVWARQQQELQTNRVLA